MTTYTLAQCTVADGAAISRNNMSAFWEDPTWVLAWRHTSLEEHIAKVTKRYPRTLLNNRETARHQKAIDPETGRVVGYARWVLPPSHTTAEDGGTVWPEAVVPAVSQEEEAEIRRVAASIDWNPNRESDELDAPLGPIKDEITAKKPYLILDYLAVHPENQRKGIATTLVKSGMEEAGKLGLDVFVMAFRAGVNVYKRLGFRIEKELIQDDSKYGGNGKFRVCFMIYERNN